MFNHMRFAGLDTYFEHFSAYSGAFADKGGDRVDSGGKCLLPPTVLQELAQKNVQYPLQFCVQSFTGKRSYCGVLEFTAAEGQVILPAWMLQSLQLEPGANVRLTSVALPRGGYVKFRPQQKAFIELANPKAVLEHHLNNYTCLVKGQSIVVRHLDEDFLIDVLETKSEQGHDVEAIFVVDTNLNVDFDRPLDMPDSPVRPAAPAMPALQGANVIGGQAGVAFAPVEYKPPSLTSSSSNNGGGSGTGGGAPAAPEPPAFTPFAGTGRTLKGTVKASASAAPGGTTTQPQQPSASSKTGGHGDGGGGATFTPFAGPGRSLK